MAAAMSNAFRPIAKAQILPQTVRAYPALADGLLCVRNDDTLVGLDLSAVDSHLRLVGSIPTRLTKLSSALSPRAKYLKNGAVAAVRLNRFP